MADRESKTLREWQRNAQGTNAGVTATENAPSVGGRKHVVDEITVYGDAPAVVTIESPAASAVYKEQFAGAFNVNRLVDVEGVKDQAILVKISASTAFCGVNVEGHEEPA